MKNGIKVRLAVLEQLADSDIGGHIYICDDGSEFQSCDYDLTYYLNHTGYYTPDGRKLVRIKRPRGSIDGLSESLYAFEDSILEAGHFELGELQSDEVL